MLRAFSLLTVVLIILSVAVVEGIFPHDDYQPAILDTDGQRNDLIKKYFNLGYSYKEILVSLLCNHRIRLGLRHLKRLLKKMGLRRRLGIYSPIADIIAAMLYEVNGSGACLGYRSMWKRLMHEHGLRVQRDTVLELMWLIDPEGVQRRKAKRLLRRRYCTPGPNFLWHLDGYDKLKPYGFAIHGAIDGYSRKILWLHVGVSNNDPIVVAGYYLQCLKLYQLCPRILRCDLGTENATLKLLQPYFRYHSEDRFAGINSIILGKSTSNQRIEAWWSVLRKQNTDWWINYFKDLRDSGVYNDGSVLHREALKFCFMPIIQAELNRVVKEWNVHILSKKRNAEGPNGKPDFIYFCPEYYGTQNFGCPIEIDDVDACKEVYGINNEQRLPCTSQFIELVDEVLPDARLPATVTEAYELFVQLTDILDQFALF